MAARWEMLFTLEVMWPCSLDAALATSTGAIIQPTRQPGMA